jgi:hypothetical protein
MKPRHSQDGRTSPVVLVALAALTASVWYASAGGEVRWASPPASLPPTGQGHVVPAMFLADAEGGTETTNATPQKKGTLTLQEQDRDPPDSRYTSVGASPVTLNGDASQKTFQVVLNGFADADLQGSRVEIRSGGIRLGQATFSAAAIAFPVQIDLWQIANAGQREIVARVFKPAVATVPEAEAFFTEPFQVTLDTQGPILRDAVFSGDPNKGPEVALEFETEDLDLSSAETPGNYRVERIREDGTFAPHEPIDAATVDHEKKNLVRLTFGKLDAGIYRVTVNGTEVAGDTKPLQDRVGNFAGGSGSKGNNQQRTFNAAARAKPGQFVEFPEFQPTLPQPQFARRINPADKVVTEVVRLYYYRDAHRVAQLINRTAESLNRAAVDLARRRAEDARVSADDATDRRRSSEREAVRRAEELRRAEHEAAQARQDLTAAQQDQQRLTDRQAALQRQIEDFEARFPNFHADYSAAAAAHRQAEVNLWQANDALANQQNQIRAKLEEIQNLQGALTQHPADHPSAPAWRQQLNAAHADLARLRTDETTLMKDRDAKQAAWNLATQQLEPFTAQKAVIDKWTSDKSAMDAAAAAASSQATSQRQLVVNKEGVLANLRNTAATANETAITAQAKEDRAREQQFRLEVSAAHEDPDTYAPAKLDSVDPVAQVSVQVIGEGLIQLRGPQKGVNKIKTAINQIDAPVGQVKVEVVTVQLNGERGERMEAPLGRVEAHLGLGRFLTAQSLMLLRQAIQEEATRIAQEQDHGSRYQIDRDRKYLYGFFGQDFIDELYEMDSEFLNTENKLLSLHSMDTVSLHQALFIMALAKNEVRQMILANFMAKVRAELVQAEFDYRCSSELAPFKTRTFFFPSDPRCKKQTHWYQVVAENNQLRYNFRNLQTFYAAMDATAGDAMNPVQREFIRLAQIFKARLVTELELKQRVIERAMIEDDRERNLLEEEQAEASIRQQVLTTTRDVRQLEFAASDGFIQALSALQVLLAQQRVRSENVALLNAARQSAENALPKLSEALPKEELDVPSVKFALHDGRTILHLLQAGQEWRPLTKQAAGAYQKARQESTNALAAIQEALQRKPHLNLLGKGDKGDAEVWLRAVESAMQNPAGGGDVFFLAGSVLRPIVEHSRTPLSFLAAAVAEDQKSIEEISQLFAEYARVADVRNFNWTATVDAYQRLSLAIKSLAGDPAQVAAIESSVQSTYRQAEQLELARKRLENARFYLQQTRSSLDRRKLLDFLIEEHESKYIDLLDGVRAQIASMDNHLKRLSIALEDDFKLQFYDPAFVRIRDAAREWDVTLGQVERTSILTNNRAFAKVMPQATMEFDLPKRKIAVAEAFDSAKALVDDYGALLNDPTFLAAYQIMGGKASNGKVQNVLPGLPSQTDEQQMGFSNPFAGPPGSSLQALVPDPSVYKFETGTGFEVRPVIQPDGNSIVYDFNYMYTTEVREPVRADEKHLGRIKRHFINTQVQTSSFELREISRYQVALKAARTSQGVPLLQDIPIAGLAFRPLPSAESSIQQNVILGSSVVYPTLFDLMGLRWAPSVVDLNHISVRDAEHVVRGRRWSIESSVFQQSSEYVDRLLGIEYDTPQQYRPDLYHRHWEPSPYHPGGHTFPGRRPDDDPTGQGYERPDRRPQEWREPPYDRRFRRPTMYETIPDQGPRFDSGTVTAPIQELRLPDGSPGVDALNLPSP